MCTIASPLARRVVYLPFSWPDEYALPLSWPYEYTYQFLGQVSILTTSLAKFVQLSVFQWMPTAPQFTRHCYRIQRPLCAVLCLWVFWSVCLFYVSRRMAVCILKMAEPNNNNCYINGDEFFFFFYGLWGSSMLQCCQVGRCSCRSVASSAAPSIDRGRLCLLFDIAAARGSNLQPTDNRQLPRRSCVT